MSSFITLDNMEQKIPGKSGFREKSGLHMFPDFFKNRFFALLCDNEVFLVFQSINSTVGLEKSASACDGSVNLQDGQREECARSAHVREFTKVE